jgi:hypothetical protein
MFKKTTSGDISSIWRSMYVNVWNIKIKKLDFPFRKIKDKEKKYLLWRCRYRRLFQQFFLHFRVCKLSYFFTNSHFFNEQKKKNSISISTAMKIQNKTTEMILLCDHATFRNDVTNNVFGCNKINTQWKKKTYSRLHLDPIYQLRLFWST